MNEATRIQQTFDQLRSHRIDSLNVTVEEYRHRVTGAQHIHIASDSDENVFTLAFRTVPQDSTGVAHILEHTALCGSEKYPVRDPFFMMIRRSLNTFMNAMTSSDWTAYPFASQNRKDYFNLLDVYLDCVFFSKLDPLDFAQEGHRLEFADPQDPASPLEFKGVVYNEMKGAMSSVVANLWHTMGKYLYPTTTYHYNSGGDPESIPDLTYEQLCAFYRTHYHPSNAIFMTFGNIPAAELHPVFEDRALKRFEPLDVTIQVPDEKRYLAPVRVEEAYAFDEGGDTAGHSHVVMGWLLGHSTDLMEAMEAHLLASVLLDNSASPLLQVLETSEQGNAPSPMCGLDDSQKELCFLCGIEGSDPDRADAFEAEVLAVLQEVAEQGIPHEQLAASLHQLELHQREVTGDGFPYGLHLVMTALTGATHRGDPVALLDLEPVLAILRERIEDPDYIKSLTRKWLLDNQHRVRLTLRPDPELSARRQAAEQARLKAIENALDDSQRREIIERAEALEARQSAEDDDSMLPKVGLADIPAEMPYTERAFRQESPVALTAYSAGTNGLVYQQIIHDLPQLDEEQIDLLPLYTSVVTELGVGEQDYLQTQQWQARVCGSIHAAVTVRGTPHDPNDLRGHLTLSAKGLQHHQEELTTLMRDTLTGVRFDELSRLRELIAQLRASREKSITGNGHILAMSAAASGISPGADLAYRWGGMEGIRALKRVDEALESEEELRKLAGSLEQLHRVLLDTPRQILAVGEQEHLDSTAETLRSTIPAAPAQNPAPFHHEMTPQRRGLFWETGTQVNFCARAYPTVPLGHEDAAALSVLGSFLRNGYLHTAIREQGGAYGGGASQDSHNGAFRFFSYRDPRLADTLADFDASLRWLHEENHDWAQVEEAILGVISAIDRPASPAGEARQTFHAELYGSTREVREHFRKQVLEVTLDDLRRVAATYLKPEVASTAVIGHPEKADEITELGLETRKL